MFKLVIDPTRCSGEGMCVESCPAQVYTRENGTVARKDAEDCMECGTCVELCPGEAIRIEEED